MATLAYEIVIVGGGQAGRRAAEGARAVAPNASIAIVGAEAYAPYDRPPLSKEVLLGLSAAADAGEKRNLESYARDGIALLRGQRVDKLDLTARRVLTADGDRIGYQRLVLATGSRARRLPIPTTIEDRVFVLRTRDDAERLSAKLAPHARIVVIGAGFIGLEVASAAIARGAQVVVLEAADRVLNRVFPAEASARVAGLHRAGGVDLRLGVKVDDMRAHGAGVLVRTSGGDVIADAVVIGIGVSPNGELASEAGIVVDDGIVVSGEGATSHPGVFAAGEVTRHPVAGASAALRLECWQVAELQAEAAGRSTAGAPTTHAQTPYFWSDQHGVNMQMFGLVAPDAKIIVREHSNGRAILFALDANGRIAGAIGFDAGSNMSVAKRLIGADAGPGLADPDTPLKKLLRSGAEAGT